MRKTFLLVLVVMFVLWGCKSHEKRKILIGFSQCMSNDLWRQTMIQEMKMAASLNPNVDLVIMDANEDSRRQVLQIDQLISKKVDILIISPNESLPITPIAVQAYKNGIPTIIIDRKIESDDFTAYIGADNFEIGKSVGLYIGNVFKGEGKILEIRGLDGSSPAADRHNGFIAGLSNFPKLQVIYSANGQWLQDKAMNIAQSAFAKDSFNIVFGQNDVMAYGARIIANKKGLNSIFIVGIDALPELGLNLVDQGQLQASFIYPTGGIKAIDLALDILEKRPFSKINYLSTSVVDATNVKVIKLQQEQVLSYQQIIEKQIGRISEQLQRFNNQRTLLNIVGISLILLVFLAVALFYFYFVSKRKNYELEQKNNAILNQKELLEKQNLQILEMNQKVESATQAKLRFFTNISHEIRTPLTLINAPLHKISKELPASYGYLHADLKMVQRNADRLLTLINQLMDFRKLELGMVDLSVSETDIVLLVSEVYKAFQPLARQKNISFGISNDQKSQLIWVDVDKINKVLFNVVSNAFKFTPENGQIKIHVATKQNEFVEIQVSDTGPGITPGKEQQIFERFFQQKEHRHMGTGIGLSLTKEFLDLHSGKIAVKNRLSCGSCFEITLKKGKSHFSDEELVSQHTIDYEAIKPVLSDARASDKVILNHTRISGISKTVMIVEDDSELRSFINRNLAPDYFIIEAKDGLDALEILKVEQPDLILTDVMMPEIDGIELTKRVKSSLTTSHIPIIMLTARTSQEQKIEGIENGADAYIEKPFNLDYLNIRIKKLLESRDSLQQYFQSHLKIPLEEINSYNSLDKNFLAKIESIMGSNYQNSEFSVEEFGDLLSISRIHLYRKIKALTGLSPIDYVNKYRLKRSRELLGNETNNIIGVAFEVGYSSAAYFSKKFRDEFNMTPTEYIKSCRDPESKDQKNKL